MYFVLWRAPPPQLVVLYPSQGPNMTLGAPMNNFDSSSHDLVVVVKGFWEEVENVKS